MRILLIYAKAAATARCDGDGQSELARVGDAIAEPSPTGRDAAGRLSRERTGEVRLGSDHCEKPAGLVLEDVMWRGRIGEAHIQLDYLALDGFFGNFGCIEVKLLVPLAQLVDGAVAVA